MNESGSGCNHNDGPQYDDESCPFCRFWRAVRSTKEKHNEFHTHIFNAQIEMLQAFKSLIDQRISTLEKRKSSKQEGKKATKIEVE